MIGLGFEFLSLQIPTLSCQAPNQFSLLNMTSGGRVIRAEVI